MVRELHSSHTNPDEKAKFKETTNNIFHIYSSPIPYFH